MIRWIFLVMLSVAAFAPGAKAAQLVMFESAYCYWCERWNDEVGEYYARTAEGRAAPLRRVDLEAPRPADLRSLRGVVMTPTFVVMDGGREVGRIVGYPDKILFWKMLAQLLARR